MCRMKTKSLRKLLNSYGATISCVSLISMGFMLPIHDLLCTKTNSYIGTGITILVLTIILNIVVTKLNKDLVKAYNEKLAKDAYDLTLQLRGDKNVDTDVLKDLLEEIRNK